MASEWIKLEMTTPDKPEVAQIAEALHCEQDLVVGKLVRVWAWADQNSIAGDRVPVTAAFIDRLARMPGLAAAMRGAGWLAGEDAALVFPGFDRHNGRTAKARAMDNRKKSVQRERVEAKVAPRSPGMRGEDLADVVVLAGAGPMSEPVPFIAPSPGKKPDAAARQVYPEGLAESAEFVKVWEEEWLPYLMERKRGQMPALITLEKHLGTCLKLRAAKAVTALRSAISKGWASPDENVKVAAGDGGASASAKLAAYYEEPEGWRAYWRGKYPPEEYPDAIRLDEGEWSDVPIDYKKQIHDGLRQGQRRSA